MTAPLKFNEAIESMLDRNVVLHGIYYGNLQPAMRSLAFSVTGVSKVSQIETILEALVTSLDNGLTFNDWKKLMLFADKSIFGLPKHRLDTIFRTNNQTAYMHGKAIFINEHKEMRPYLTYSAVDDERTREEHRAMNGMVAAVDDPIWGRWYPPSGFRCRCSVISLTEKSAEVRNAKDADSLLKDPEKITNRANAQPDKGWDYSILNGVLSEQTRRSIAPHFGGQYDIFLNEMVRNLDKIDGLLK